MAITTPTYYPQPWAANETMPPLSDADMAAGYPAGSGEKPSRQSINAALQYAINGVLYFLTTGVPQWLPDAVYNTGAIVTYNGGYYRCLVDGSLDQQPDVNGWEMLPWRKADLDALYLSMAEADARYLTPAAGDARYYTQAAANATFLTIDNAAAQYATQAALDAGYLTHAQADALYLTMAQGDARYALLTDAVTKTQLNTTLAAYETSMHASQTYMTQYAADLRYMTPAQADAAYEKQTHAAATYLRLSDVAMSTYSPTVAYSRGILVLDPTTAVAYVSSADSNIGNPLTDTNWWHPWSLPAAANLVGVVPTTPVFDGAAATSFKMTLTSDVSSSSMANILAGNLYTFQIMQDSTGGRAFAWPTNVHNGSAVPVAPNAGIVQTFVADDTNNLYPIGGATTF